VERNHLKNKELFSAVTHEIKNSLNPVINLSSVLLRSSAGRLTSEENSYLEVIERNGKKILHTVEEFSYLNKLPEKSRKHFVSSVAVAEVIESALMKMMTISSNNGCKLICDVDDKSSVLNTDSEVFRRVIENICLFFLSLSSDDPSIFFGGTLSRSEFMLSASRKKTDLIMNDETVFDKDKIIEKGYSASSVMWLDFASIYIKHLNGSIHFSHDVAGEAVFSFTIPSAAEGNQNQIDYKSENDEYTYGSNREFVMLVIDDDTDNIIPVNAIIEHEFKGMGKVYHAESGGKGLDLIAEIDPDIILLDLTLPDMNGLFLVRNIKNLFLKKNIPVIAFTGVDIARDRDKMIRSGFDDVIQKPFNIDLFIDKIRKWIV